MKNLSNTSFISSVKGLYLKIITMDELVLASSMGWIFWTIDQVFPRQRETITIIFLLLLGIGLIYTIINLPKTKLRDTKSWRRSFMRLFNIPGSILFLFLFFNSFFKISEPINQKFSAQIKSLEETYSTTLFGMFIVSVFILAVFRFFIVLKKILFGQMEERKYFWKEIILIILIIVILLPLILEKTNIPFYATFFAFILKWFFGISLLFLHLNYLIKETKIFLKKGLK